jgi:hypothetical protein
MRAHGLPVDHDVPYQRVHSRGASHGHLVASVVLRVFTIYRLVGTEIVARWGSDDTGRYLDEMPASRSTDLSLKLYGIALSRRAALYAPERMASATRWNAGASSCWRRT